MLITNEQAGVIHAVLTGDIVNSTKLAPETEKELLDELGRIMEPYEFEFYRGDSFQAYMKDPLQALKVALLCRTTAISRGAEGGETVISDMKISIGIGPVIAPVKSLGTARGEAFLLSGRSLDEIQDTDRRLSIITGNPLADIGLQVMSDYLDAICRRMTVKQAEAISGLLKGLTQQELAQHLDKSRSTVSQHVNAGGWSEIERILQQYENLIKQLL